MGNVVANITQLIMY